MQNEILDVYLTMIEYCRFPSIMNSLSSACWIKADAVLRSDTALPR